jgi:hypothetical protein
MKFVNEYGLPAPIVNAISKQRQYKENRYSVTDLLKSPQEYILAKRHDNEIEVDVSDGIWALFGSAVHYILDKGNKEGLSEQYLSAEIEGVTLAGVADLYEEGGILTDWKITSVYSFLLGDKIEWERQLNIYKWLYEQSGMEVKQLKINAILRDWQKSKSFADEDYPKIPFIKKDIPIMPKQEIEDYIRLRIKVLKECEKELNDDNLPECTSEEKWERKPSFAIKKEGRKSAVQVFEKREYAEKMLKTLDNKHLIEERKGIKTKCENYCKVQKFCSQYKKENEI